MRAAIKRGLAFCLLLLFLPALALGEDLSESLDEGVDKIFRMTKAVGGAFVIAKDGDLVYDR